MRPENRSIYHLWKAFDMNSNVAGACGEIAVYRGKRWLGLLNPLSMCAFVCCVHSVNCCLVAAQNFEYKITNMIDKPTESLFGYISVLVRSLIWQLVTPLLTWYIAWSILCIQVHRAAE